jgi:hypothetical protein
MLTTVMHSLDSPYRVITCHPSLADWSDIFSVVFDALFTVAAISGNACWIAGCFTQGARFTILYV